jgi:Ca-activated chloride channel family protein
MFFSNKIFLLFLFVLPVLAILGFIGFKLKTTKLKKFVGAKLFSELIPADSKERQIIKFILKLLALLFLIIALAGPRFGTKIVEVKRQGLDVLIAIDTSLSMLAEDIKPNRISQAKIELNRLANAISESGNRIGIIAFAGESLVQCPLTLDVNAVKLFLDFVDIGTVVKQGTEIGKTIKLAINTFDKKERKYKVLVLLTDGEDHDSDVLKQAEDAKKEGIKIFTIGFGKKSGEIIPIRDESGKIIDYKKDENGNTVNSKLDEDLLKNISAITDGKYYYSQNGFLDVDHIVSDINSFEKKDLNSKMTQQYEEKFYYFLLIAILLLILEIFIRETKE